MSNEAQTAVAEVEAEKSVLSPHLHHVNLKTLRVDEMLDWYGKVIGMTEIHKFPGGAWMSNDEANHRIALLTSANLSDDDAKRGHTGLHHTAYEYATLDDLLGTIVRLKGLGIVPHMVLDHGMTISFYFVDPDGNSVELQNDWFDDWSKSKDFMLHSAEFEADPIGTFADPDQVIAAWRAGTSKDELHKRIYSGEFEPDERPDMRYDP